MNAPIGLKTVRRPVRRPIRPVVVREPARMPVWVRGTLEAIAGLLIALLAYSLVTDIADRRVVEAHNEGVVLGQQIVRMNACRPDQWPQ